MARALAARISGEVGIGWPPPPRQPPGHAMNSMKWHSLSLPPALMSSITLWALAVPWATASFSVAPFRKSNVGMMWRMRAGTSALTCVTGNST